MPGTSNIAKLDYDKADIHMLCTSKVEREKRLVACAKESETIQFLEALPYQSVFVDVGANTGAYSLVAASLGHWVLAFEASPKNFERLVENIKLNEGAAERIFACPYALWWKKEKLYLKLSSSQVGAAEHALHRGAGETAYPLDDVLENLPVPTHLKVDVDGWELEVLMGATKTLQGLKGLQVEIDDRLPSSRIIPEWLQARGFAQTNWARHGSTPISNVRWER